MIAEVKAFAKEKYTPTDNYAHGCWCEFMPKCDKWGIKLYYDKEKRDENFHWQSLAAEHGLGPEVGVKFEFYKGGSILYCYVTEKVEPLWDSRRDNDDWDLNMELNRKYRNEVNFLQVDLLNKIGFKFNDRHVGNVAFKDGNLICIDFGVCD
jgi:hypothetical protein